MAKLATETESFLHIGNSDATAKVSSPSPAPAAQPAADNNAKNTLEKATKAAAASPSAANTPCSSTGTCPIQNNFNTPCIQQFTQIFPIDKEEDESDIQYETRVQNLYNAFIASMKKYSINTKEQQALFLGQVGHETESLNAMSEVDGENREGTDYYGRGGLQLTGESTYEAYNNFKHAENKTDATDYTDITTLNSIANDPTFVADSAGWFYTKYKNINSYDTVDADTIKEVTKKVNYWEAIGYLYYDLSTKENNGTITADEKKQLDIVKGVYKDLKQKIPEETQLESMSVNYTQRVTMTNNAFKVLQDDKICDSSAAA